MLLQPWLSICGVFAALSFSVAAGLVKRSVVPPGFVTAKGTEFQVDGKSFVGTLLNHQPITQ